MSLRQKLSMMVVDDMSVSRGLIEQALDWMGIVNVAYEKDGASAFRRLAASPVHLVISDYNMPGADGLTLLEGLRMNKSTAKIGFILISGRADKDVIERGHRLGMNNFMTKPFTREALRVAIEGVVGRL